MERGGKKGGRKEGKYFRNEYLKNLMDGRKWKEKEDI